MRPLRSRVWACAALAFALGMLGACGTARIIQRTPHDGVIELEGDHNKAMEQANEQMASLCGSNFIVLREGVEPVAPGASGDGPTAYRVHYECGDGGALGAAPAAPPSDSRP